MNVSVKSYDYGDHWEAHINGGWWIGRGTTKEKAIKAAIKRFEQEHECLTLEKLGAYTQGNLL